MAYDVFVAVCALLGLVLGVWKGFTLQVAGILSLVLGFALGAPLTRVVLGQLEDASPGVGLLVFLGCFAVIALVCNLVAVAIRRRLEERELRQWDRQLGGVFGVVHGLFLCLMLSFALVVIAPSLRDPILERPSGRAMSQAFRVIHDFLPEEVQEAMVPLIERGRSGG